MRRLVSSALILLYITVTFGGTWRVIPSAEPTATPVANATIIYAIQQPTPTPETITVDQYDAELIAKTLYGEARGCSVVEQAAVAWCILNRVDEVGYGMGESVEHVVTFPGQFLGYHPDNPMLPELLAVAEDVLTRWTREQHGETDVGRVLPKEYMWFSGDNYHNYFRNSYSGGQTWDWSLPDPYTEKIK